MLGFPEQGLNLGPAVRCREFCYAEKYDQRIAVYGIWE